MFKCFYRGFLREKVILAIQRGIGGLNNKSDDENIKEIQGFFYRVFFLGLSIKNRNILNGLTTQVETKLVYRNFLTIWRMTLQFISGVLFGMILTWLILLN